MRINLGNKKQHWVCGRALEGKSCLSGPDKQGQCHNRSECQPLKKGERWYCSRPMPCQQGPLPDGACAHQVGLCQPELSPKAKIARSNLWLLLAAFGMVLMLLATNAYSPGQLSQSHRVLEDQCQRCHSAGQLNKLAVLGLAFAPFQHDKENALCLDCHYLGEHAALAHGLPVAAQSVLTEKIQTHLKTTVHQDSKIDKLPLDGLSCISCHREHQGGSLQLTGISDKTCQSCHLQSFIHFELHPEFSLYPYENKSNILFDHQSHIGKNFAEEEDLKQYAPENCNDCHRADGDGAFMQTKGFDKTCNNCHLQDIQGAAQTAAKGIEVFNLPGMDVDTLRTKGLVTGYWPENADAPLSGYMRLLLADNAQAVSALERLGKLDTLDLRKATQEQLQAATDLMWSIKQLLFELQQNGQAILISGLEKAVEQKIYPQQFAGLVNGLSPAVIDQALKNWLPGLKDEILLYRQGDLAALAALKPAEQEPKPEVTQQTKTKSTASDDLLGDELLGGDDLLSGDDDLLSDLVDLSEDKAADETNDVGRHTVTAIAEEEWVSAGGWYRSYYSLYYRPSAHADKFLQNWLELCTQSSTNVLKQVCKRIATPKAQGMCLKCHSTGDKGRINWRSKKPLADRQSFTRFAHNPHTTITETVNCTSCHRLSETVQDKKNTEFHTGFQNVVKSQCSDCHNQVRPASENCLKCHNYHTGTVALKLNKTDLSLLDKKRSK